METWSVVFSIINHGLSTSENQKEKISCFEFEAYDFESAKQKLLHALKSKIRRIKDMRRRTVLVQAMPFLSENRLIVNGTKCIRVRYRYANRRILWIKNPDAIFVYGLGNEALNRLCE